MRIDIDRNKLLESIHIYSEREKKEKDNIRRFLKEKNFNMVGFNYSGLVENERKIALEKYALGKPINEVKKHFRRAAQYAEELANIQIKTNTFYQGWLTMDAVYGAIISDEVDLAKRIARNIKTYLDLTSFDEELHPFGVSTTNALRNFILENDEKAVEEISNIKVDKAGEGIEFYYQGQLYRALIERDVDLVEENLGELLKRHDNQVKWGWLKGMPEGYFCIPSVALTKLARQRGLEVKVEEIPEKLRKYLPMELIE